ncbi:MAG TPA: hypothetical protein VH165_01500 [Kofleriaceae bacterium]|jgi:hypothetical protein|nr:hypothetical protein [Kofleriaceae bacterium]
MFRACAVAVVLAAAATPAYAYEFWLRAETIGQAYQLRDYRLIGPDLFLGRRRYTQTLALRIWDVGDLSAARREARLPDRGLRISFQTYLRIDHDFGDYSSGSVLIPLSVPVRRDALDVVPELGDSIASLELLYGYVELAGLVDDRLTLQLGRVVTGDGWETGAMDGVAAKLDVPSTPLTVSATAGLAVRASSPLGVSAYELDGTSGAACQEYVEGPMPGTGTWQLIDRNRTIVNSPLSSDYEYCPQRDVRQPTIGVTIATAKLHGFGAELGFRRTSSDTVGLIGPVDRLQYPDLGLYPNDYGQAPASGVNEERVWARAHGELALGGVAIAPYADLRYSLLQAVIDRADAGVRLSRGATTLEPSIEYFYPTFDGDSIFNAFSLEPTTDLRLAYQRAGAFALQASGWLRIYHHQDDTSSVAGGGDAGVDHPFGPHWRGRVDALWDDGYGGRRLGATGEAAWHPIPEIWVRGRAVTLAVASDEGGAGSSVHPRYVTDSTVFSMTWKLSDGVALHTILEADYDAIHDLQYRAIGVFDFAFTPEP